MSSATKPLQSPMVWSCTAHALSVGLEFGLKKGIGLEFGVKKLGYATYLGEGGGVQEK